MRERGKTNQNDFLKMKNAILFFLLFAASCADSRFDPTLQDELQGEWVRTDDHTRHYIFGPDYATTWVFNFGSILAPKWYSVEPYEDSALLLTEINTGNTAVWGFGEVRGDSVTVVEQANGGKFYFNLKRQ